MFFLKIDNEISSTGIILLFDQYRILAKQQNDTDVIRLRHTTNTLQHISCVMTCDAHLNSKGKPVQF